MGEPVLIAARDARTISVHAVRPPPSRRKEIEAALSDLQAAGLVAFTATSGEPDEVSLEALGDVSGSSSESRLVDSPLAKEFGSAQELASRAPAIVKAVEELYAQAWALQRRAGISGLKESPARWLSEVMHRDHSARLQMLLRQIEEATQPLGPVEPGCTVASSQTPLGAAGELTAIIHRLFAPTGPVDFAVVESDLTRLPKLMAMLKCAAR